MIKYKKKYIYRERGIFMSFTLGNPIAVSTNFIKSNPAVPVYKGTEEPENLFGVIYHIEIGYNENNKEKIKQYIIIDFKEYDLSSESKQELIALAKSYCESKNISEDDELEITLLDNEEVENFLEKVFNNMKVIRGLISEKL